MEQREVSQGFAICLMREDGSTIIAKTAAMMFRIRRDNQNCAVLRDRRELGRWAIGSMPADGGPAPLGDLHSRTRRPRRVDRSQAACDGMDGAVGSISGFCNLPHARGRSTIIAKTAAMMFRIAATTKTALSFAIGASWAVAIGSMPRR